MESVLSPAPVKFQHESSQTQPLLTFLSNMSYVLNRVNK